MQTKIKFKVLTLSKLPNQLLRRHFREITREKNLVYQSIQYALPSYRGKPFKRARFKLTRHSSVEPDWDGLVGSFKFVIDAFVAFNLLENDAPKNIGSSKVFWKYAPPKKGFIEIEFHGLQ